MYTMEHGRVRTFALEVHAVDHCNLACVQCCTLAPYLPPRVADPEEVHADLLALAAVLRPEVVKLTGGEPTLHPDLCALVDAVRRADIAPEVSITTNGFLLPRQPDALFAAIDRLTLSWYGSRPLPEGAVARIEERCQRFGVRLSVKPTSVFQQITPEGLGDAQQAWDSCWMKQRCHTVHRGFLYLCGRAPHLATHRSDGVELAAPDLRARLLERLRREGPLLACATCLGNSGPLLPHAQLR
jgi:cyclic pyranopterin phosphate synthase